jgi:XTP/dITP diphosphohydrolase
MKLVFATHNRNKVIEIQSVLGNAFELLIPEDVGIYEDVEETGILLEENASIKSSHLYKLTQLACFADDTGLEVQALNGQPGVHSARYAGYDRNNEANIDLLLANLSAHHDRSARFRTVISLIIEGKEYLFDGIVNGHILSERRGTNGFGYDAVFCPDGYDTSFAQMSMEEKNKISHRAKAFAKMVSFLKETYI